MHVNGHVDPADDIDTINTELILADLQTIDNALPKLEKDLRGKKIEPSYMEAVQKAKEILESGRTIDQAAQAGEIDKNDIADLHLLTAKPFIYVSYMEAVQKAKEILESGRTIDQAAQAGEIDKNDIADLHLLTAKPFIYVFNVDDAELTNEEFKKKLADSVAPAPAIFLNAQFEAELTELDEADAREMLEDAGLSESGLDQLARVGFDILGLQTFLTAGEKEVRAWQIHKGWTAPQAAGVIHTDFEKGFIKAEVVSYDDFVAADGSMAKIKEEGKLRLEGKDYVMQDGDITEFKFNVSKG